jgi:hypothetical protein
MLTNYLIIMVTCCFDRVLFFFTHKIYILIIRVAQNYLMLHLKCTVFL